MARYDLPKAAPEPLRLVQRFVNTVDHEHGREWLGSVAELRAWLGERGLAAGRVGQADLECAHELREALRALLRANNDGRPERAALEVVNRHPPSVRLDERGEAVVQPAGSGFAGVLVAVVVRAMLDGSWRRLKACRQCGWAFYDYSNNRSASWCSMAICGNRLKTRAYRSRRARR